MALSDESTIIGIDGGGTRTRGILFKSGKILAQSNAGTTRIGAVGVGESCERLLNIINDLCLQANINSSEIDIIVVGLAGVWLEEEKLRSRNLLKTLARNQKIVLNDVIILSDAELAIEGAYDGEYGVIMIVGTGSIAIAKLPNGKIERCGGWGIELDDEGSGAWIGREGLTAIVRSLDFRGKTTMLTEVFAEKYPQIDLGQPRTIVKAYSDKVFEYHMLSPLVMNCAEKGDEVCLEIINRAADHLIELLEAISKHFKTKTIPVMLLGGVIESDTLLSKILFEKIKSLKRIKRIEPKGTALNGALKIGKSYLDEILK